MRFYGAEYNNIERGEFYENFELKQKTKLRNF